MIDFAEWIRAVWLPQWERHVQYGAPRVAHDKALLTELHAKARDELIRRGVFRPQEKPSDGI